MAQDGDTITYTFDENLDSDDDLIPKTEDISSIDEIEIVYIDGESGNSPSSEGSGGRVDNVIADVSGFDTLYIWVAGEGYGRYGRGSTGGGGSTEVSLLDTNNSDSDTEPFIAGAGGGGALIGTFPGEPRDAGARGGDGVDGGSDGEGEAPPAGGDGSGDGDGAVDGHSGTEATIIDSGTTTEGGGSTDGEDGEVQISYGTSLDPPEPPQNLTAELL